MRYSARILFVVILLSTGSAAPGGEMAREWLDQMQRALDEQTYVGTFVRINEQGPETFQVSHRYVDGALHERIISLSGVGREIIRQDDEVHLIYPDQKVVRVERFLASNPMVAALPGYSRQLEANYELREFSTELMAGRKAQIISISPRDDYRNGYLLWLDSETKMPLRSKSWDGDGRIFEDIIFTTIEFPADLPDSMLAQTSDTSGFTVLQSSEPKLERAPEAPASIDRLPPGFELIASMLKTMDLTPKPILPKAITRSAARMRFR
jgi:sigma-E factor negative regulatory protein RseB